MCSNLESRDVHNELNDLAKVISKESGQRDASGKKQEKRGKLRKEWLNRSSQKLMF